MTAILINLRDYERPARAVVIREVDAEVVILPVIRVARPFVELHNAERAVNPPRLPRCSLLGDP